MKKIKSGSPVIIFPGEQAEKQEETMKKTMKATALFLAAGLLLTACGGKTDTAATTAAAESAKADAETTAAAAETDAKKPSFVFVCTGQLGDKSFNDSANAGMEKIASDLGCEIKVIEIGRDQTKWEPTFQDLAEEGKYDVIISNGSSSAEVIEQVAEEFPDQKFVMFDSDMEEGKWPNLYAISYKQNEGSYLAGVLAALVTESKDMPNANEDKKIGFVGGSEHPIITDFLVGYIAGAKSVDRISRYTFPTSVPGMIPQRVKRQLSPSTIRALILSSRLLSRPDLAA